MTDKLTLQDITKTFGTRVALKPLNLSFAEGLTTVLIGPSGCGKSTLLRLLNGLITPDSGRILVDNKPVKREDFLSLRRRIGYVIQDGGLFPHLTARENIVLLAGYLGWPQDRMQIRLEELCSMTKFPKSGLQRYPVQLSGGQQQRVSLMRALMLDPDILLLDEPLGALDPMIRSELQSDLRDIFQGLRKTVVLVTHDIGEAAFFADTIVLFKDGRVLQTGKTADFIQRPADDFVTRFINAQRQLTLEL